MWEENPEYQKAAGWFLLVLIGLLTLLILINSVFTSNYIYIIAWISGLLFFGLICIIYGMIALGLAKTVFTILNFLNGTKGRK
jgi:hypothetical protein